MIYVRELIQYKPLDLSNDLECVVVIIILSPEMSFSVFVLYRPPSENKFFDKLSVIFKMFNGVLVGDFNLNWLDKIRGKKLKGIANKFHLTS